MMNNDELLTTDEVAKRLKIHRQTFYNLCCKYRKEGRPVPRISFPGLGKRFV